MTDQPNMVTAVREAVTTLLDVEAMMRAEDTANAIRRGGDPGLRSALTKQVGESIRNLRAVLATLNAAQRDLMFETFDDPPSAAVMNPRPE